ncbi:MAG: NAD(P)H-dependent oxidoreductase subunit E [Verrucomicrobiota bacterium]|nr:NAD(P)H-dependent oxidoreductase subunit E [Verrucomicrobiota bacterium]
MNLKPETLAEIERVIPVYPKKRSAVLPLLHAVQEDQGYISNEAVEWVAQKLELQPINVYEVVTFYPHFRQKPIGKHHIRLCRTLACALCGGYKMSELLEQEFGCKMGETSADGKVTLEFVECLAACGTAPVALIGDDLYERLDEPKVRKLCAAIKADTLKPKASYESEPRDLAPTR